MVSVLQSAIARIMSAFQLKVALVARTCVTRMLVRHSGVAHADSFVFEKLSDSIVVGGVLLGLRDVTCFRLRAERSPPLLNARIVSFGHVPRILRAFTLDALGGQANFGRLRRVPCMPRKDVLLVVLNPSFDPLEI